jgi:hypothetical protein
MVGQGGGKAQGVTDPHPKKGAIRPGTNPTTWSYNAHVVEIYSAANSVARLQNKNYFC